MKFRPDGFILGMAAAVLLAWSFPAPGAAGGWLHPELLTKAGIALIFFLHGVALSGTALKAGALRWPLHLLVQSSTFLLFPLLGLAIYAALGTHADPDVKIGLFYLCALPSTVSSSVALTAAARGNVAGALFNATLSSLLGVVLTPLWVTVVLQNAGEAVALGPVVRDLVCWLVLPLLAGQCCRPVLGGWAARHKAAVNRADRATILVLVYTSFCDSFHTGVWSGHGARILALVVGIALLLFAIVMTLVAVAADALGFSREDRIAAMFCGSKKTLASGVPMAKLIFRAQPGLGLILLPIMLYHPMQLVICGWLAGRWGKRAA